MYSAMGGWIRRTDKQTAAARGSFLPVEVEPHATVDELSLEQVAVEFGCSSSRMPAGETPPKKITVESING